MGIIPSFLSRMPPVSVFTDLMELEERLLVSDCESEGTQNRARNPKSNMVFFISQMLVTFEYARLAAIISLRRHYPEQVGGFDLSAL